MSIAYPTNLTIAAVAGVVPDDDCTVGGVEANFIVSRPYDFVGVQTYIWIGVDSVDCIRDYFVSAVLQAIVIVNVGVMFVGIVDVSDILIFPNAVRYADIVVNDINVGIIKAAHALDTLGRSVQQLLIPAALENSQARHVDPYSIQRGRSRDIQAA